MAIGKKENNARRIGKDENGKTSRVNKNINNRINH